MGLSLVILRETGVNSETTVAAKDEEFAKPRPNPTHNTRLACHKADQ